MTDNPLSLKEFWNVVRHLNSDVKRCMTALHETLEDDEEEKIFWRRMYAQAVFALFDGATYQMMFHAYVGRHGHDVVFSVEELMRLEKYYDFDEDQEAVTAFSRKLMLENIRFAFNAFARVYYSDYIVPTHEPNWMLIEEIARIRNRLQYPSETRELEVYEENINDLAEGLLWFVERMVDLLESCQIHTEEKIAELESGTDEVIM